jgi:hypothetical protein
LVLLGRILNQSSEFLLRNNIANDHDVSKIMDGENCFCDFICSNQARDIAARAKQLGDKVREDVVRVFAEYVRCTAAGREVTKQGFVDVKTH